MPLSIKLFGDRNESQRFLSVGKSLLKYVKDTMELTGLKYWGLHKNYGDLQVKVMSMRILPFGSPVPELDSYDFIEITTVSPISPIFLKKGYEEETSLLFIPADFMLEGEDGAYLYYLLPTLYEYRLLFSKDGAATIKLKKKSSISIEYYGGLCSTVQHESAVPNNSAFLATNFTLHPDFELGIIDWKRGLLDYEVPDHHLMWGDALAGTISGFQYHGTNIQHSRHPVFYADDLKSVKGRVLRFNTTGYDEYLMSLRHEVVNYKHEINKYQIRWVDTDAIGHDGVIIGEDSVACRDIENDTGDVYAWEYFVPIMAITDTKAVYRQVTQLHSGTNCANPESGNYACCPDIDYIEKLIVGDTIIESGDYHSESRYTGIKVIGDDVVARDTYHQYGISICTTMPEAVFSVSGTGYSITPTGLLYADGTSCGVATVSVELPHCEVISKQIRGYGEWILDPPLGCFRQGLPGTGDSLEIVETIDGEWKYETYSRLWDLGADGCTPYTTWKDSAENPCTPFDTTCTFVTSNPPYWWRWRVVYTNFRYRWACY